MKRFALLAVLAFEAALSYGQGTGFSYQGRLLDSGSPANGVYDLEFVLRDAAMGGNSFATNQTTSVTVSNGLFSVLLDFGADAFGGGPRWLQIGARPNGSAANYTAMSPAQQITATPYAVLAGGLAPELMIPPGSITAYMGTNAPPGWLLCDGAGVSRTQYWRLFEVIGTASGFGDGATTFNVLDLRGMFLRGMDGTAGMDPDKATRAAAKPGGNAGNALGSLQQHEFQSHTHANGNFNRVLQVTGSYTTTTFDDTGGGEPDLVHSAPMSAPGGSETRPRNIYVNYIIKF